MIATSITFAVFAATGASAQQAELAAIDAQLANNLDFRSAAFRVCLNAPVCEVDGVRLEGGRLESGADAWQAADLYWDPVDGIGVTGGGQNDEIDVNERVVVTFSGQRPVQGIWVSDVFSGEHRRFGGSSVRGVDEEYAHVQFSVSGAVVGDMRISAENRLPWQAFNNHISSRFQGDGDLRRRIVVNKRMLELIVPGSDPGADVLITAPIDGEVEKEKLDIFEGVPTVEIDLTEILAALEGAPLYAAGTLNANRIVEILERPELLDEMTAHARRHRVLGDRDNGEVAGMLDSPVMADTLTFQSPLDTSNDFSIAGVVFSE